jgi:hypothetical protein
VDRDSKKIVFHQLKDANTTQLVNFEKFINLKIINLRITNLGIVTLKTDGK